MSLPGSENKVQSIRKEIALGLQFLLHPSSQEDETQEFWYHRLPSNSVSDLLQPNRLTLAQRAVSSQRLQYATHIFSVFWDEEYMIRIQDASILEY